MRRVALCKRLTLKNCMRGYVLCRQFSWQNFSFYFVLNLDTGPRYCIMKSYTMVKNMVEKWNLGPKTIQIMCVDGEIEDYNIC